MSRKIHFDNILPFQLQAELRFKSKLVELKMSGLCSWLFSIIKPFVCGGTDAVRALGGARDVLRSRSCYRLFARLVEDASS